MRKQPLVALGLVSLLCGCGGGKPAATATPTAAPVAVQPTATSTLDLPTPESAEEKQYKKLKHEAETLALGKGFAEAIPMLEQCEKIHPDDPQVPYYLMICKGNLEKEPSPKSEAYQYAKKVRELAPETSQAERATDYILSAESEPAKPLKDISADPVAAVANDPTFSDRDLYVLPVACNMLDAKAVGLTQEIKKQLWYLEVRPDVVADKIALPKGTKMTILKCFHFNYGKNYWRGNIQELPDQLDTTFFTLRAFRVEIEDGPAAKKKGFIVNQMDRFVKYSDQAEEIWGVKIGPRIPIDFTKGSSR